MTYVLTTGQAQTILTPSRPEESRSFEKKWGPAFKNIMEFVVKEIVGL